MAKTKIIRLVSLFGGILISAWPADAGLLRGTPVAPSGSLQETALVTSSKILQSSSVRLGQEPSHSLFKESENEDGGIFVQSPAARFDEEPAHSLFEQSEDDGGGGYVVSRTGQVMRRPLLTRMAAPTSTERAGRGPMPSFGWQQKFKPLGEIKPLTALARLKKRNPEASSSSAATTSTASSNYSPPASVDVERVRGRKPPATILHDRPSETSKPASPQPRPAESRAPNIISRNYRSIADPNTTHFITGTPAEVDKFIREKQKDDERALKSRELQAKADAVAAKKVEQTQAKAGALAAKKAEQSQAKPVVSVSANKPAGGGSPASAVPSRTLDQIAKEDADMRAKWQEANRRAEKAEAELARKAQESAKQQGTKSSAKPATQKNIPPSDGGRGAAVIPAPAAVSSPAAKATAAQPASNPAASAQAREAAEVAQRQQQQAVVNVRDRQYSESVDRFHELSRRGQYTEAAAALQQAYANSAYTTPDNIKQRMDVIEGLAKTLPANAISQNPVLSNMFAPQTRPQPQLVAVSAAPKLTPQQMEDQSRQEREAIVANARARLLAEAKEQRARQGFVGNMVPANSSPATQLLAMANVTYSRPELLMGSGPNVGQTSPMVRAGGGSSGGVMMAKPLMPATYAPSSPTGSRSLSAAQVAAIRAKEGK